VAEQVLGKILNGKYRLLSVLGEGAMGVVYRTEQLDVTGRSLREVALKTLRPALSNDENFSRRFLDEVRVAAQLRSAHIVTLYDVGADEDGQLYYTMELVRGQTLKELLQREGALPLPRVAHLTNQICEALSEAHGLPHPIVHRDLKPANIFVEPRRENEELVKVGDFGIAKILGEQHTQHTAIGTPGPGTPRYMAPEQWKGAELSNRTDLYALGGMMYELLSGKPPFVAQGGGIEALMYQHLTQSPPPLPTTIPAEIRSLIGRLLAKEPADRPQDALVVSQALKTALTGAQEEKTIILATTEDAVPKGVAQTEKANVREEQPSQVVVPTQSEAAREVSRPQSATSSRLEKKSHRQREATWSRKKGRVMIMLAVIFGVFHGGRALFKEGVWEKYWAQDRTELQPGPQMGRKNESAQEAAKTPHDPSSVTKPDEAMQENQDTARGTAIPQSSPDEKPSSVQSPSSPSLSASLDKQPPEPPQLPPPQGSLSVSVSVEAAKVSLNGEYVGMARNGTPLEVTKLAVGQQQVRVDAEGYESMEYTANIQDGKLTKLEFPLTRLLSVPSAASISVPPDRSHAIPSSTNNRQHAVPSTSEDEDAPAVIFYGPDGKPISKSQLERRQQILGNRNR